MEREPVAIFQTTYCTLRVPDNGHPDRYITGPIIIIPASPTPLGSSSVLSPLFELLSSLFSWYLRNFPPLGRLLFSPTVSAEGPPVYRDESGPGSDGTSVTNDPDSRLSSTVRPSRSRPGQSGCCPLRPTVAQFLVHCVFEG